MKNLDDSWRGWLRENIDRGCDKEELLGILLDHDFSLAAIRDAMREHFPAQSPRALQAAQNASVDHEGFYNVRLTKVADDARIQKYPSDKIQLYTIADFLSAAECDQISDIIRKNNRPSTVTVKAENDPYFRTSSTSDLSLLKDKIVDDLDVKIAQMLGVTRSHSEGIQGQHYAVGQEFKFHTDFFQPRTKEYAEHASLRGNRTWTFMVYLNNVVKGGGTHFKHLDHIFTPQKGMAVVWNNLHRDGSPNYETLHAGMPVVEGEKIIITKWFRERGAGRAFYSE